MMRVKNIFVLIKNKILIVGMISLMVIIGFLKK